jgi:hypothetical protein
MSCTPWTLIFWPLPLFICLLKISPTQNFLTFNNIWPPGLWLFLFLNSAIARSYSTFPLASFISYSSPMVLWT